MVLLLRSVQFNGILMMIFGIFVVVVALLLVFLVNTDVTWNLLSPNTNYEYHQTKSIKTIKFIGSTTTSII